jgi:hypothetical protein
MTTTPAPDPDLDDLTRYQVSGEAGDFLFKEGDEGGALFIVQDGQIELVKTEGDDQRQLVLLGVGDVFGEDGLVGDEPRKVAARGATGFRALKIDRAAFEQMVREHPGVAIGIMKQLAVRQPWAKAASAADTGPTRDRGPVEPSGPPRLVLLEGDRTLPLPEVEVAVVGRINRATGATPDVDLTDVDTERSLSRRHAEIVRREGRLHLRETKKTQNGTFVNGKRVETGVDVPLTDGDRLRFGLIKAIFRT